MNSADCAARARAAWDWVRGLPLVVVLLAALAVAIGGWARSSSRADSAEKRAAVAAEAAQVDAANVARAHAVTREGLDRTIAATEDRERKATGRASQLEAEVKRLLAAAPGGHVVSTEAGDTGWIPTGGAGAGSTAAPAGGQLSPSGGSPPAGRECWFWAGDEGRILPVTVRARYRTGRVVGLVGVAQAFGRPAGDASEGRLLFGGPLSFDAAELEDAPVEPGRILGLGFGTSTLTQRWQASGLFLTKPVQVPLLGRWRAWVFAAGGPGPEKKVELLFHGGAATEF